MLFKGTDRFKKGEIDLITLKNGGGNNAFTSHDFTAYYFNFASDRWEIALEIEADRMVNCAFDPDEFEAEKEGRHRGAENRARLALGFAFAGGGGRCLQGASISESDCRLAAGCGTSHRRAAASVLSPILSSEQCNSRYCRGLRYGRSPDAKCEHFFGSIPAGPPPAPMLLHEPPQRGERRLVVRWRSKVPRLAIAYHAPEIAHPDTLCAAGSCGRSRGRQSIAPVSTHGGARANRDFCLGGIRRSKGSDAVSYPVGSSRRPFD